MTKKKDWEDLRRRLIEIWHWVYLFYTTWTDQTTIRTYMKSLERNICLRQLNSSILTEQKHAWYLDKRYSNFTSTFDFDESVFKPCVWRNCTWFVVFFNIQSKWVTHSVIIYPSRWHNTFFFFFIFIDYNQWVRLCHFKQTIFIALEFYSQKYLN